MFSEYNVLYTTKHKLEGIRMMKMTYIIGICLLSVTCAIASEPVRLTSSSQPAGTISESVKNEAVASVNRGLDWLASTQRDDGSWSDTNFPALTALPLWAFSKSDHPRKNEIIDKAVKFITLCVQPDGGIYKKVAGKKGGGLSNYNTSICITALHATGKPELTKIIQEGRKFIAGSQHFGDDEYSGGFGYDKDNKRAYTDLLNTFYAAEAMKMTSSVEDLKAKDATKTDINWTETVKFIERLQNKESAGSEQAGGFVYNPTDPKAGTITNEAGKVVFRSYGSITYAGMLAMIYANVSRDDVRVRSAFDWSSKHWSLDENPGMGQMGLYFFYTVLARSLNAYGAELIPQKDGNAINWREDALKKVISLQKRVEATGMGNWKNDTDRYWEGDPVLVTSYSLLALQYTLTD